MSWRHVSSSFTVESPHQLPIPQGEYPNVDVWVRLPSGEQRWMCFMELSEIARLISRGQDDQSEAHLPLNDLSDTIVVPRLTRKVVIEVVARMLNDGTLMDASHPMDDDSPLPSSFFEVLTFENDFNADLE